DGLIMHSRSCPARQRANHPRAFSSEVDTGSREENASKLESRAPLRLHWNGSLPPPYGRPAHLAPDAGWPPNWRNLRHTFAGANAESAGVYWAAARAAA